MRLAKNKHKSKSGEKVCPGKSNGTEHSGTVNQMLTVTTVLYLVPTLT